VHRLVSSGVAPETATTNPIDRVLSTVQRWRKRKRGEGISRCAGPPTDSEAEKKFHHQSIKNLVLKEA